MRHEKINNLVIHLTIMSLTGKINGNY